MIFRWLAGLIIRCAQRSPYRKGHLLHADGSLYMGRYSLFETRWISARVHQIATADYDNVFHDHPWNFASVVLRGGYTEARPCEVDPLFYDGVERFECRYRSAGSLAYRSTCDRHRVVFVERDTWSLFIYGRKRQWWGFFTPAGKVYFADFASCHVTGHRPSE